MRYGAYLAETSYFSSYVLIELTIHNHNHHHYHNLDYLIKSGRFEMQLFIYLLVPKIVFNK